MTRKISLFIIVLLFAGCGTTKKITQVEVLPTWVKVKPVSNTYYTGVGSAIKTSNISEYQSAAKSNALADLTGEISVKISTGSVLHKFESALGYSEDYSAVTKATTNEHLEGYELVNTYESETHYYVYYQLSKAKYAAIKEERKASAVQKGADFLEKGNQSREKNDYNGAISNYISGLVAVKQYLSESMETEFKGKTIYLGNELFNGYQSTVNDIYIVPNKKYLKVKKGMSASVSRLKFEVKNSKGKKLSGLPIVYSTGKLPLRDNKTESDLEGEVSYQLNQIRSKSDKVVFTAKLDATTLAMSVTQDILFRNLIRKTDMPQNKVIIEIAKPIFFIESQERNFKTPINKELLKNKVQQILLANGFYVVSEKNKADFILAFDTDTKRQKREGRMYYAELTGTFKMFNAKNELVYFQDINNVVGVQLNYNDAGISAYKTLFNKFDNNLAEKITEAIN